MAHKIEPSPTGRASCRGCKKTIAKGELRFGEEFQNAYSEDGGMSYRYWHLPCAATKLANELRDALKSYPGPVDDRASLDALVTEHLRAEMPHAERAPNGRAKCRACDETIKKDELRVAFERTFDGPMGPQKGAGYVHPRCVPTYLARERQRGSEAMDRDATFQRVLANTTLLAPDRAELERELADAPEPPPPPEAVPAPDA